MVLNIVPKYVTSEEQRLVQDKLSSGAEAEFSPISLSHAVFTLLFGTRTLDHNYISQILAYVRNCLGIC